MYHLNPFPRRFRSHSVDIREESDGGISFTLGSLGQLLQMACLDDLHNVLGDPRANIL